MFATIFVTLICAIALYTFMNRPKPIDNREMEAHKKFVQAFEEKRKR